MSNLQKLVVLCIVVGAVVGGILLYNHYKIDMNEGGESYMPTLPDGWLKIVDDSNGISYGVNPNWPDEIVVSKFDLDEPIHVGFGAPVYVRYNSSLKLWQTLGTDANNEPTIVRTDSIITMRAKLAEGKYPTATYTTGDGTLSQVRVLIVKGSSVVQIQLPTADSIFETEPQLEDYESSVDSFIGTISFN